MREIKMSLPWQVSEDGAVVLMSGSANIIKKNADGSIEGLTINSQKIIQEYDLNHQSEVNFRNGLNRLREFEKNFDSDLKVPIQYFCTALNQISTLNRNSHKHVRGTDNLLRTILYANTITALESFFSDFLIAFILKNDLVLKNVAKNYEPFKSEKHSLKDLIEEGKTAKDLALEKLKLVVFHNLNTAKAIYTAAFEINFPKFGVLTAAVENRHDIVHRNGYKQDAEHPEQYTKVNVLALVFTVSSFVSEILGEIKDRNL